MILDVDGTVIDSNDAHARAWVDAAAALGYAIRYEDVRPLIGMGGDRIMPRLAGIEQDSPEGQALKEERGRIFRSQYLPHLEPLPRVRELIQRLRDDGFHVVVASSASEEDLGRLLEQAGVADLLEDTTSSSDAERSKPEPDIVEAAIAQARPPRDRLVMIGDTPYDVEAARRAGIPIIAVRSGGWDDPDLEGAVAVFEHTGHILDEYEKVFSQ